MALPLFSARSALATLRHQLGGGLAALWLGASCAFAAPLSGPLLETRGFEGYPLGALTPDSMPGQPQLGQQGWVGVAQGSGALNATTNVTGAVVQSAVVQSGSQALRVERKANIDNRWAVLFGTNSATLPLTLPANRITLPSARFVLVDWDMRVPDAGGNGTSEFGPYFGVEAYDSSGVGGLMGSLGVDASTGEVLYQTADDGILTAAGPLVQFDQWNHYSILLDYSLDTYSVYLNGARLKSVTFVDNPNVVGGLNHFTDADIAAFSAAGNAASLGMTGFAYFDNFRVLDGLPADFDNDGDVDGADLGFWRTAFATTSVANADADGDTDGHDFLIWQQNLGVDLIPALAAGAPVPEPAAAAIASVLLPLVSGAWQRRTA